MKSDTDEGEGEARPELYPNPMEGMTRKALEPMREKENAAKKWQKSARRSRETDRQKKKEKQLRKIN